MTDGTLTATYSNYIGDHGVGTFTQSGGTNNCTYDIILGYYAGSNGTYNLSENGILNVGDYLRVGYYSGTGSFNQTGGINNIGASNTYGSLSVATSSGDHGTYSLSGTGSLSANSEFIGSTASANGLFQQSGGINTITKQLSIAANGQYLLSGGTMQIQGSLTNRGIFDFRYGSGVINVTGYSIVNLAMPGSSLLNTGSATLNVGATSLLIVPSGFDPNTAFLHYANAGELHTAGTPFNIASG